MPHYGTPAIWRLDKNLAGSGALGDFGAHIIDLAHYLVGDIKQCQCDGKNIHRQSRWTGWKKHFQS